MDSSVEEMPIEMTNRLVVSGCVKSDTDGKVCVFIMRILGYVPESNAKQILPDYLLPFLGSEWSLSRHDHDDSPILVVSRTWSPITLKELCGALNVLKENALGYCTEFIFDIETESTNSEMIATWLSTPDSTPKVIGDDKGWCDAIAKLTQGEGARERPPSGYGFGPWIQEAHAKFRRHYLVNHLRDLDHFLGGI